VTFVQIFLFFYILSKYIIDPNNFTSCIDAWHVGFYVNGMALNPDESEAVLLGTRRRAHSCSNLTIVNVAGCQIPLADHKNSWCYIR